MNKATSSMDMNDVFELSKKDKEGLKKWTPDKIKAYVVYFQERLEGLGNKCNTYVAFWEQTEKNLADIQKDGTFISDDFVEPRW